MSQDPAAMSQFVDWIGPLIDHWCRRLSLQDREDMARDVLVLILQKMKTFQGGSESTFRGWVRIIVRNRIADLYRQREKMPQAVGGDAAYQRLLQHTVEALGEGDDQESSILLWHALEQIRGDFQEQVFRAFWLHEVEGLPSAELQKILGMNANAIRQARLRVRRRLLEVYGDLER